MTLQFDAKQQVLKAYPEDRDAGVDLFRTIVQVSEDDFEYEEGVKFEEYIYGLSTEHSKTRQSDISRKTV